MSDRMHHLAKQVTRMWCVSVLVCALDVFALCFPTQAAESRYWELSPYTIRIHLAVDDSLRYQPLLDLDLAAWLEQRIFTTLHPLWSSEIVVAQGPERYLILDSLATLADHLPEQGNQFDKQIYLTIVAEAEGYRLSSREWDQHTRLWGPVIRRHNRQDLMLPNHCFELLRSTFAPLASVRSDTEDKKLAKLVFKGSELPRRTDDAIFQVSGDVYQPLLIRSDHKGEVLPNGVTAVPWTFLSLGEPIDGQWLSKVYSGIRRPFGLRRRGRSEHLAIALRNPPGTTRVRFYARHDKSRSLSGYEVFIRLPAEEKSTPMGLTNANGSVEVTSSDGDIVTLFLRSDGQLLAKVPVPPGAKPYIEVPIADDTARLRAQAELTALREQLIDIVARRNILIARARNRLLDNQLDEAKDLLANLDDLPGRGQFNQMISSAERAPDNISSDPRVQQKIEQLFAQTRKLLGRFLAVRQISELRNEVNSAAQSNPN